MIQAGCGCNSAGCDGTCGTYTPTVTLTTWPPQRHGDPRFYKLLDEIAEVGIFPNRSDGIGVRIGRRYTIANAIHVAIAVRGRLRHDMQPVLVVEDDRLRPEGEAVIVPALPVPA